MTQLSLFWNITLEESLWIFPSFSCQNNWAKNVVSRMTWKKVSMTLWCIDPIPIPNCLDETEICLPTLTGLVNGQDELFAPLSKMILDDLDAPLHDVRLISACKSCKSLQTNSNYFNIFQQSVLQKNLKNQDQTKTTMIDINWYGF